MMSNNAKQVRRATQRLKPREKDDLPKLVRTIKLRLSTITNAARELEADLAKIEEALDEQE